LSRKSPRETLQNCGELTESQGSSDEANVVSETEISSQISESILDEEKDCINKSLVEEIGYSTEVQSIKNWCCAPKKGV